MNKESEQPVTFCAHDCRKNKIWSNQGMDCTYERCMICNKIVSFRWKSFWKRLKELF